MTAKNLNGAIAIAEKFAALQEKRQPGPLVLGAVQQADKSMHERYQTVQELGGVVCSEAL
ncbi:hypothetical protein LRS06_22375 [Hymenobacter sp. J193]|uniref:hypothetical protein n=1 Tax=Hymenobacter sp. J193 TaxID=2898429 RepID=UPI002151A0E2|nr:hypothetical protein [Hymenobacter sp. J193]MCR5890478.1 hypothetical protein [Hymenobacter sp. J193]